MRRLSQSGSQGTRADSDRPLPARLIHIVSAIFALSQRSALNRGWLAAVLVGLGVYGVAIVGARALLNDGDTLAHIAIGRWIITHHAIPSDDPFSFAARGQRWVPHEWLSEVVFAALYDQLGWGGVAAATALAAAIAFALLTRALDRHLGPAKAAIGALAAFSLAESHFLARPHALAWPVLVVWIASVVSARDHGRAPSLTLLPVMVLWCNLHGGFVVGLLFVAMIALEAVALAPASAVNDTIRAWGLFAGAAGLAALVSPNGTAALLLPIKMLNMNFALGSISEWRAVDFAHFEPLQLWIALAFLAATSSGVRLPVSRILMILLLLWMALTHIRNEELLGIIAPLLLASPLARQLGLSNSVDEAKLPQSWPSGRNAARAATSAAIAFGFVASAWALDRCGLTPRPDVAPVAAVEAARRAGLTGNVFNTARFGGYLMLENIPTFIDGRADLFGDAFLKNYVAASNGIGRTLPDLLNRFAIGWTLLEPSTPAVGLLDHLPGWKRVYADRWAVVHRRIGPAP